MIISSIDEQLEDLWQSAQLGRRTQSRRRGLRRRLLNVITQRWPHADLDLAIFGSFAQGIRTHDSDLDLCIIDKARPLGRIGHQKGQGHGKATWYNVETLAAAIRARAQPQAFGTPAWSMTFRDVRAVTNAKVPLVTLIACGKGRDIKVDIVVNNRIGLMKTCLAKDYLALQSDTLLPLYHAIKTWFKVSGLNESAAKKGPRSLSGYAIKVIFIDFLQQHGLLPDLQDSLLLDQLRIAHSHFRYHRDSAQAGAPRMWDVTFFRPGKRPEDVQEWVMGEEWARYRFYRHEAEAHLQHPDDPSVWWHQPDLLESEYEPDLDPFLLDSNVASNVNSMDVARRLEAATKRAVKITKAHGWRLSDLIGGCDWEESESEYVESEYFGSERSLSP